MHMFVGNDKGVRLLEHVGLLERMWWTFIFFSIERKVTSWIFFCLFCGLKYRSITLSLIGVKLPGY